METGKGEIDKGSFMAVGAAVVLAWEDVSHRDHTTSNFYKVLALHNVMCFLDL